MADFLIMENHILCYCCCFEASMKSVFFLLLFQVDFHKVFGSPRNVINFPKRFAKYVQGACSEIQRALKTSHSEFN